MHVPGSPAELAALVAAAAITLACARRLGLALVACIAACEAIAFALIGNVTMPFVFTGVALALVLRGTSVGPAPAFARQCAVLLAGLGVYVLARMVVESESAPAVANARDIIAFERALGLYREPAVQETVLRSEALTRAFNWFYSFGFLSFVAGALVWLWATDSVSYRFLRNSLAVAVVPAVITIAAFPVAPPRLLADSGMVDTVAVFGREHAYSNEFAALPSLHVGWMAVTGVALAMAMSNRWRWLVALAPGSMMMATVLVTGNHYWVDGVIGTAYSLLFLAMTYRHALAREGAAMARVAARGTVLLASELVGALASPRVALSMIGLGALVTYMAGMQITHPGFTDFWGYLLAQVLVITVVLLLAEVVFRRQGGLSSMTHFIAVACCYADVLGTDGNLYANINEYDKLTHFAGVAAITAGVYDGLRCMRMRGWIRIPSTELIAAAIMTGLTVGVAWEVYEFMGDKVFHTLRVQSKWDTGHDILSDAAGAISMAVLLWLGEAPARSRDTTLEGMLDRSPNDPF